MGVGKLVTCMVVVVMMSSVAYAQMGDCQKHISEEIERLEGLQADLSGVTGIVAYQTLIADVDDERRNMVEQCIQQFTISDDPAFRTKCRTRLVEVLDSLDVAQKRLLDEPETHAEEIAQSLIEDYRAVQRDCVPSVSP